MSAADRPAHLTEPRRVRGVLLFIALGFLALFLLVPLAAVFAEAFKKGWQVYWAAISEPDEGQMKLTASPPVATGWGSGTGAGVAGAVAVPAGAEAPGLGTGVTPGGAMGRVTTPVSLTSTETEAGLMGLA